MLQAHSLLWNYLWIAPNLVFLVVGFLIWKRGLARRFRAFLAFTIIGGLGELAVFGADNAPFVSAPNYWRISWAVLLLEGLLKFLIVGEDLSKLLVPYPSVSRLANPGQRGWSRSDSDSRYGRRLCSRRQPDATDFRLSSSGAN